MGQRDALERTNGALLRIWRRQSAIEHLRDGPVPLPFRQQDFANALGLSLVHTNKTVADFRRQRLVRLQSGRLTIPDTKRPAAAAGVSDAYAEKRSIL